MRRFLLALSALALGALAAPAAEPTVTIRWHGQSFFEIISSAGTRIVTDPHGIEAYGRKLVQADIVLMSHFHVDHTRLDVIENLRQAKQINALKKVDDGKRDDWNVIDEKFKDVRIQTVGSYHDTTSGQQRGKNGIFILEMDGLRIVHLGDLGHTLTRDQVRRIGAVDVLLIPVGGIYTINGLDAQKVVEQLKPRRYIIPMHYGTAVYTDLLSLDMTYFLDDQTMGVVRKVPSNELLIDAKAEAPKQPIIAILGWAGKGDVGKEK
jgi:L-ascorbate metabolism protein UlaG (beta-lactamase superfamily)